MTHKIFVALLVFFLSSCNKRLNEVTATNGDIKVTKYEVSEITSTHDFIEVKKGNSAITVMKAESYGFADIIIDHDTIIIQCLPTVFYEIADKAFDYKVRLDTTISINYWRQKVEEREKL